MAPDFIERSNRTTVYGIIAIVLIVVVVAIFLRVRPLSIFSQDEGISLTGFATAESFYGTRIVNLEPHEMLSARISVAGLGSREYKAYPDDGFITVMMDGRSYESELALYDDGVYHASYPDNGVDAVVSVVPEAATIWVKGLLSYDNELRISSPAIITKVYDGKLYVRGVEIGVQHVLGSSELLFHVDGQTAAVGMSQMEDGLVGIWSWEGQHTVHLDPVSWTVIVDELY